MTRSQRRVGVIQSAYIPWRGYFDFIGSVDIFVIYDDVQYSTGSYRNRNQVKTAGGLKWLTVPVHASVSLNVDQVQIADVGRRPWRDAHASLIHDALSPAQHFADALALWNAGTGAGETSLSALNVRLLTLVNEYLGIKTPVLMSSTLGLSGHGTDRLIELLGKLEATHYLSGPSAKAYLEEQKFRDAGIALEYKSYDYEPYTQLWGDFVGAVTILDLIANVGRDAARFTRSRTPDILAVPAGIA